MGEQVEEEEGARHAEAAEQQRADEAEEKRGMPIAREQLGLEVASLAPPALDVELASDDARPHPAPGPHGAEAIGQSRQAGAALPRLEGLCKSRVEGLGV